MLAMLLSCLFQESVSAKAEMTEKIVPMFFFYRVCSITTIDNIFKEAEETLIQYNAKVNLYVTKHGGEKTYRAQKVFEKYIRCLWK